MIKGLVFQRFGFSNEEVGNENVFRNHHFHFSVAKMQRKSV
jgi:hypothetical protein